MQTNGGIEKSRSKKKYLMTSESPSIAKTYLKIIPYEVSNHIYAQNYLCKTQAKKI